MLIRFYFFYLVDIFKNNTFFYNISNFNFVPNHELLIYEGSKKYYEITDNRPLNIYRQIYAAYPKIFMLDLYILLYNILFSNCVRIGKTDIFCLKDLFQLASSTGDYKIINKKNLFKIYQFYPSHKGGLHYFLDTHPEDKLKHYASRFLELAENPETKPKLMTIDEDYYLYKVMDL